MPVRGRTAAHDQPVRAQPPILIFFTCFGLVGVAACFIVGHARRGELC
jgi:hypothetical protein